MTLLRHALAVVVCPFTVAVLVPLWLARRGGLMPALAGSAAGLAMQTAGLDPVYPGFVDGFDQIIQIKILQALGVRQRALWERAVPWNIGSRLVDSRLALSAHPVGRRAAGGAA